MPSDREKNPAKGVTSSDGFMAVPGRKLFGDGPAKDPVIRPTFTVPVKSIKEANKWEVGRKYRVTLVVEQKSVRDDDGKDGPIVEFEVHKIKAA